jgi:hypothetical protein
MQLPDFKTIHWNDLERLFGIFHSTVMEESMRLFDFAPGPLRGFQKELHNFYIWKKNQLELQIVLLPKYLERLESMSEEERAAHKAQTLLQQRVEDRLTAGHTSAVALKALEGK